MCWRFCAIVDLMRTCKGEIYSHTFFYEPQTNMSVHRRLTNTSPNPECQNVKRQLHLHVAPQIDGMECNENGVLYICWEGMAVRIEMQENYCHLFHNWPFGIQK